MSTGSRFLNRLRVILDGTVTAANIIDKAAAAHPDRKLLFSDLPLPAPLNESPPTLLVIRDFIIHAGKCLDLAGMKRYDRVAIYKSNSPDYCLYTLAIIRSGGIAVPINAGMPEEKLKQYLAYTGASFVITDKEHFGRQITNPASFPAAVRWVFTEDMEKPAIAHQDKDPVQLGKDDIVLLVHTSGTTGFPKAVICHSGSIIQGIKMHYIGEPISADNKIAIAGHFNHLVCLLGMFTALLGNMRVYGYSRHEPSFLLEQIGKQKISIFFAFPDIYLNMYLFGLAPYDLSSVKVWIGTADASHEIHKEAFCRKGTALKFLSRRLLPAIFIEPLGASEVGFAALQHYYGAKSKRSLDRCIGRPLPHGPKVKVADEEGKRVKAGIPGRLMVKGRTVFGGYWNAHDLLAGVMKDGWWFTGDIVYRDHWGRYYHLDRLTDVITTGNGDVFSLLAEEILLTHSRVGEVVVIGLTHPIKGMVPVAIIQEKNGLAESQHPLNPGDILDWAGRNLRLVTPIETIILVTKEDIPRGLTGKVLKREMRESYAALFPGSDPV
ncbi:class I adenylate-forming enzyme family protein [Flavitalea flava]